MFKLNLLTPEKRLVIETEIDEVVVPGYKGQLDIMPGHAPLVTTLSTGVLRYRVKGQPALQTVAVSWGYCQVNPEGVVVLAETAESMAEIDRERARTSQEKAKAKLLEPFLEADQMAKLQRRLARANARLDALNHELNH